MDTYHISCALSGLVILPSDEVSVLLLLDDQLITTPLFGKYDGSEWITDIGPLSYQMAEDTLGAMGIGYSFPEDGLVNLELLSKLVTKDNKRSSNSFVAISFIHRKIYDKFLEESKRYVKSTFFEYPYSTEQQTDFNAACVEFGIDQESTNHIFANSGETFELNYHLIQSSCDHPSLEKTIARMVIEGTLSDDESMDLLEMYTNDCIVPSKSQSSALRKFNANLHFNGEQHYGYVNCVDKMFQWFGPVYQSSISDLDNVHLLHFGKTINVPRVQGLLGLCDDRLFYETFENIQALKTGLDSSGIVLRRSIPIKGIEASHWGSVAIARGVLNLVHDRALDSLDWIETCDGGHKIETDTMTQSEIIDVLVDHELDETWWA
jgi:hypothetical protein